MADSVRTWCSNRRVQHLDPTPVRNTGELRAACAVIVADQEARSRAERWRLAQVPGDPGISRMPRDANVDNRARATVDGEKGEERPEAQVDDRQDVARPDLMGVMMQDGRPCLAARMAGALRASVAPDGVLTDVDSEREEVAVETLRAPQPVLRRQSLDQHDRFGRYLRSLRRRRRPETPDQAIPLAMPASPCVRLDDEQGGPPAMGQTRQQDEQQPVTGREHGTLDLTLEHDHLLTEEWVLGRQRDRAPRDISDHSAHEQPLGRLGLREEPVVDASY